MRVNPRRRRRWNNLLILCVLIFIVLLNLPTIIKTYLLHDAPTNKAHYLLNPQYQLRALYASQWSLQEQANGQWVIQPADKADNAAELAQRWTKIVGTPVDDTTYRKLAQKLPAAQTIEAWYVDKEEPQRITFYRLPKFWLLKNWQNNWIAVTVDDHYLIPK